MLDKLRITSPVKKAHVPDTYHELSSKLGGGALNPQRRKRASLEEECPCVGHVFIMSDRKTFPMSTVYIRCQGPRERYRGIACTLGAALAGYWPTEEN